MGTLTAMSNVVNNIKSKFSSNKDDNNNNESEQSFSIQPHPAKTNDPADLQPNQGLRGDNNSASAFNARGPHVPAPHIANNLEETRSRDELRRRQEELNQ